MINEGKLRSEKILITKNYKKKKKKCQNYSHRKVVFSISIPWEI